MLKEEVQKNMVEAMKMHDKERKTTLSMLSAAIKNKEIELGRGLKEEEEVQVVSKMAKQATESMSMTPPERTDLLEKFKNELAVYQSFLPEQMGEKEIRTVVEETLSMLGLTNSAGKKDKGKIMKELMPKVKGKADGKLVNNILSEYLN